MLPYASLLFSLTVPREPFYYFSLHWQIVFICSSLIGGFLAQASMVRASRGHSPHVIPCVYVAGHSGLLLLSRMKAACWDFITFVLLDSAYFPWGLVHLTGVSCIAGRPMGYGFTQPLDTNHPRRMVYPNIPRMNPKLVFLLSRLEI